jgi:outer membrane protein assembly factor BamB
MHYPKNQVLTVVTLLLVAFSKTALADVTSWRNGGYGLYPDAKAPIDWADDKNILWKIETPIWGNASPLIIGDRLIYTAEPTELICVDANTGKILWQNSNSYEDVLEMSPKERKKIRQIIQANENLTETLQPLEKQIYQLNRRLRNDSSNEKLQDQLTKATRDLEDLKESAGEIPEEFLKPKTHDTNGYASMTCFSDGKYIYSCNGLGIVTKHDLDGNRVWGKFMERPDHNWGNAVSPQIVDGKLIVRISDYTALDPETGDELWRVKDPHTFGTPASFEVEGQWYLYTVRGELIRVRDGKKLKSQDWTIEQKTFAFFNTPFVDGNRVYVVHGAAGIQGDVYCMEIPDTAKEVDSQGLKQIWHTVASKERYYVSPVSHEGLLYIMSMGDVFQALDTNTGEIVYSEKIAGMKGRAFSGILLVDGKLFVGEEDGTAVFIQPGSEYKELARFNLGENRSTPIFDGDTAYLRTREHLIAFRNDS